MVMGMVFADGDGDACDGDAEAADGEGAWGEPARARCGKGRQGAGVAPTLLFRLKALLAPALAGAPREPLVLRGPWGAGQRPRERESA